uniref:Uncharacterized protein n=1 Tax=Avena sativa TaxID=4498 RepID=A0ACD5WC95_AVESA
MSGGSGEDSPEGPSGEDGRAELRRIYDRVEALLPRVDELAADRASLEEINRTQQGLLETLRARLLQAGESRNRWKTAYIGLPLLANAKIAELEENDLEDSKSSEALFDIDSSGSKIQLKEARNCVHLSQNSECNDDTARDLREELGKLKQAYETLKTNEDKEFSALLALKEFMWNQFRTINEDNVMLLNKKELEAAEATEIAKKLQRLVEEMQVIARNKDNEIGRLRAEDVNAKERVLILEGKLLELNSMVKKKNREIQKNAEQMQVLARNKDNEIGRLQAEAVNTEERVLILEGKLLEQNSLAKKKTDKMQQLVEEMQVTALNKDNEIGRLREEAVNAKERVSVLDGKLLELNSLAKEKNQEIQKNVEEMQVLARNKDNEIGRLRAEAVSANERVLILGDKLLEQSSLAKKENDEIQQNVKEMQVAARHKDSEIGRLRAEAVNAKERVLILEGKLLKLSSLAKEKNEEIQKNVEEIDNVIGRSRAEAVTAKENVRVLEGKILEINNSAKKKINEIQQNVEEMRLATQNKDNEIGRLQAEAVIVKERVKIIFAKLLEVNSLAKEENDKMQKNAKDMQVAAQNKDNEIGKLLEEVVGAKKKLMILEGKLMEMHSLDVAKNDEIQKMKIGQSEILKCKCVPPLSNETSQKRRRDTRDMHIQPIHRC